MNKAYYSLDDIIGKSSAILNAVRIAQISSKTDSNLLIQGESGTGKELFAQAIHNNSSRKKHSFIALNCSAIPADLIESELFGFSKGSFTGASKDYPGKFEQADKGTLFLDEIGDMPISAQAKLLRVLQERKVTRIGDIKQREFDVRIIAATHKNIEDENTEVSFRKDLLFRIKVLNFIIPALRHRKEDIKELVNVFTIKYSVKMNKNIEFVSEEFIKACENYNWPGNIRQLQNIIEREVAMTSKDQKVISHIPNTLLVNKELTSKNSLKPLWEIEKEAILNTLISVNNNVSKSSEILQIGRASLYRKIKKYNISI